MMRSLVKALRVGAFPALVLLVCLLSPSVALAAQPGYLVNIIDTSSWSPPSPDPSGLVYVSPTGRLLVVDGEVEEMPKHFVGFNVFETTVSGQLTGTFTTVDYSQEPTGITFDADRYDFFFVDDDKERVHQVDPGADGAFGTKDDQVGWFSTADFGLGDPEGVTYANGDLYISDGVGAEIYKVSPGANGVFDGVPPKGDDQASHFDTAVLGIADPEGVAYSRRTGSLFIVGTNSALVEASLDGALLRTIDLSAVTTLAPSDIAVAPASALPGVDHLYISDRGIDNGVDPEENDGKIYEVTLDRSEFPFDMELVTNGGFEIDNNADGSPDKWTKTSRFTRNSGSVHSGAYSGRFLATDNSSFGVSQTINYLSPGQTYTFSGWVDIPQTSDAFTFGISIRWRDAANVLLATNTVKSYTGATGGWDNATLTAVAPSGAVSAQIYLQATSLNATVFVDDLSLGAGEQPPTTTTTTLPPTTTTTAPPTTTTLPPTTTTTLPPTTTTTLPPVYVETLANGGFEQGTGVGRPVGWTSSKKFTQSTATVHGGLYSGRLYATDNSSLTIGQSTGVTPGKTYQFSGWVSIPPTADTFTFRLQLKFRNATGAVIVARDLGTYSGPTTGWVNTSLTHVAPAGAVTAYVQMDASSLGDAIFIDDFSLAAAEQPPTTTTTTEPPTTTTTTTTTTTEPPPTTTTTTEPPPTTTTTTLPPTTTTTLPPTTTTTLPPTTTTTLPPTGVETLLNGGFELDADGNGRPDSWTSSSKLTRSAESVLSGLYSGRFYAADNSGVTIKQYVTATPGVAYTFSGWVNIPPTADAFGFKIQVKFQNEAGSVTGIYLVKSYSAPTNGWDYATVAAALAPSGAVTAYVQIDASSLAGAIYVDDFSLTRP